MRRFECEEGSKKFWQVAVSGAELTVTFGRLGTAGQTKTKSLGSAEAAANEEAKLIREKTAKGYVEAAAVVAASAVAVAPAPSAPPAPPAPSPAAPSVPPVSAEYLAWLRSEPMRGPTKAFSLQLLAQDHPDLPERVVAALMNGQIDGSFSFTAHDVLHWLGISAPLAAMRVPAGFFVPYLDDADRNARSCAAAGLALASTSRALDELRARIASKKATDRYTALSLAYRVFTARDADAAAARELLPQLVAASQSAKGQAADLAKAVIEAATALASRVAPTGLPEREDLAALAASAPADPVIEARLLLGRGTLDFARGADRRIDFEMLAGITGLSTEAVKPHAARLCLQPSQRMAFTERGLYWQDSAFRESTEQPHPVTDELGISPWAIEKLVLAGDTAKLDEVLAPWARVQLAPRHTSSAGPPLKWRDGKPLSPKAQAFFLACHANPTPWRPIAELLATLLDDDASFELGRWLLADPTAHATEHNLLPPSRRMAAELARAAEHELLPRRAAEYNGLQALAPYRRWQMRWWATQKGTWRSSYLRPSAMLFGGAPTDEEIAIEQPGSTALWERLVVDAFEEAMIAQHTFVSHALERLFSNPLVRRVMRGVVLAFEGHGLAWLDRDGLQSAAGRLQPEGHTSVVVAHPLVHGALPDTGIETPFAQRTRPTFESRSTEVSLPKSEWRERTHAMGYCEKVTIPGEGPSPGAYRKLVHSELSFEIDHRGMSKSPVTLRSAHHKTIQVPSALAVSELALDLHRLAGSQPLAPLPVPAPVPPPEVLDASFWDKAR